jgi:signal transduction histidine kinase/ActR/RegA family two-component response regulator
MKREIVSMAVGAEADVACVRAAAKTLAHLAGLDALDQTRFAIAVSEIARNALQHGGGGTARFSLREESGRWRVAATVTDHGRGFDALPPPEWLSDGRGLAVAHRMADHLHIRSDSAGTTVSAMKLVPPQADVDTFDIEAWGKRLAPTPGAQLNLVRQQGGELAEALEKLRAANEDLVARRAEAEEARRMAEEAKDAKAAFLATMSHEIRTPMSAIIGLADVLAGTDLRPDQRRYVETIIGSGNHLLALINNVLDLSKLESGRFELDNHRFDVRRVLDDAMALVRQAAAAKGLALRHEVSAEVPREVIADHTRICQILVNFLSNAVKFTGTGAVTVTVSAGKSDSDGRLALRFSVSDTGPGLTADQLGRLFVPYSQVAPPRGPGQTGTGLGLSICRQLAELMGGSVGAVSRVGAGSTFRCEIPVTAVPARSPAAEQAAPPGRETASPDPGLRILIAEDNPTNQLILEVMLQASGLDATFVTSGSAAIRAVAENPFDVVLMDVEMPDTDGLAATRAIREADGRVHQPWIVGLTANAMAGDRDRCLAAGMDDYLMKPVRRETLLQALTRSDHREARGGGEDVRQGVGGNGLGDQAQHARLQAGGAGSG